MVPKIFSNYEPGKYFLNLYVSDPKSTQWFRGKIVNIGNQPNQSQTLVKVFLIDYGLLLDDINCTTCVRELPRIMTFTKGLAKIVNLAGIRPLTVSVDFHLGKKYFFYTVAD